MLKPTFAALAFIMCCGPAAAETSPYSGQERRPIKAFSEGFAEGLRAGAGLGFAKAAELNGYPGPAHLLDLADDIPLSAAQVEAIQGMFNRMQADAIALGASLLDAERALDESFKRRRIDNATLNDLTRIASEARGRLRARHLAAHLEATAVLSQHQIERYSQLRGYDSTGQRRRHGHAH